MNEGKLQLGLSLRTVQCTVCYSCIQYSMLHVAFAFGPTIGTIYAHFQQFQSCVHSIRFRACHMTVSYRLMTEARLAWD